MWASPPFTLFSLLWVDVGGLFIKPMTEWIERACIKRFMRWNRNTLSFKYPRLLGELLEKATTIFFIET